MNDSSMKKARIALVTGASRGIGKAAALALAERGFDVAITARTLQEGEAHERGAMTSDTRPVAGSLQTTADEIRQRGRQALPLRMDLLDVASIDSALDTLLQQWGHIDVLVNNGLYQGPGTMNPLVELTPELMQKVFQGNVFSQLHIVQRCLPGMLARNSGRIVNMVSGAGTLDPQLPASKGGWGFAYAASKAAFARMASLLKVEHADSALQCFNLDPGFVVTEIMKARGMADSYAAQFGGAPPSGAAAVIAWLAGAKETQEFHGKTVDAQRLCLKLQLLPDWRQRKES